MEQLGTVLRDSDYKAGVAYLTEYKHMLIEAGISWSHLLQKTFGQVARAINRAKGPAKKAAEVEERKWHEACSMETNETAKGVSSPQTGFVRSSHRVDVEGGGTGGDPQGGHPHRREGKAGALDLEAHQDGSRRERFETHTTVLLPRRMRMGRNLPIYDHENSLGPHPYRGRQAGTWRQGGGGDEGTDRGSLEKIVWKKSVRPLGKEIRCFAVHS